MQKPTIQWSPDAYWIGHKNGYATGRVIDADGKRVVPNHGYVKQALLIVSSPDKYDDADVSKARRVVGNLPKMRAVRPIPQQRIFD